MPTKKRNWPILIIVMIILAVLASVITAYALLSHTKNDEISGCKDNGGMLFCITPTSNPKIVDAKITNNTGNKYTAKFTSTCTEPHLVVDGQIENTLIACGQALTDVVVNPGSSQTYQLHIPEKFKSKTVIISARWSSLVSGELSIKLL